MCIAKLLEYAAQKNCVHAVKFLLDKKEELGITHEHKQKALFFALAAGAMDVLPLLGVQKGTSALKRFETFLQEKDQRGVTLSDIIKAFSLSVEAENNYVTKKLFKAYKDQLVAHACQENSLTMDVFFYAIEKKHCDVSQKLLDNEKSLNYIKNFFATEEWSFDLEDIEITQFLMEYKERLELTPENSFDALQSAAYEDSPEAVEVLLKNFDYSREQLQEILDYLGRYGDNFTFDVQAVRQLIEDAMNK